MWRKRVVMGRTCRLLILSPMHLLTIFGVLAAADAFSADSKLHISNVERRRIGKVKGGYMVDGNSVVIENVPRGNVYHC